MALQDRDDDDVDFSDDDDSILLTDDEILTDSFERTSSIELGVPIRQAINNTDPHLLSVLIKEYYMPPERTINHGRTTRRLKRISPHTMLTHVISRGDSACTQIILQNIFQGFIYPTIIDHVCSNGRTALWYACRMGNLKVAQILVEDGHASINKCGVLIVAAQNGHEDVVEYLLIRGCDPNRRAKNYNERALHAASRQNHLRIVRLLLEYGADPNILDYKERTALDYAIYKKHLEIAELLINHLDGQFIMNQTGVTPLMLATRCNNRPIMNLLSNILPDQQIVEELALLACNYIIYSVANKRRQAYGYFEQLLSRTVPNYNNASCEAYEFQKECQTLNELALIRNDDNAMRMYALLVSERLLLDRGEIRHLISMINKQSDKYKVHRKFQRCLQLRLHVYQILIQTQKNIRHYHQLYEESLRELMNILLILLRNENTVPFESFVLAWKWAIERANNTISEVLFKFIYIATYVSIMSILYM